MTQSYRVQQGQPVAVDTTAFFILKGGKYEI